MKLKLVATFEQLHAAGCVQTGADVYDNVDIAKGTFGPMFDGLNQITQQHPCNGCPIAGKCGAQKAYEVIDLSIESPLNAIFEEAVSDLVRDFGGVHRQTEAERQQARKAKQVYNLRMRQGPLYHPPQPKKPAGPARQRCPACGQKIRGENHADHCKPKG